jgi:hypothetical protein
MGGYVTRYKVPATDHGGAFDFLTIRGSGHMVPQMQPVSAFSFFSSWVKNQPFAPYVPKKGSISISSPGTEGTALLLNNSTVIVSATPESARNTRADLAALKGQLASQERVWEKQRQAMQGTIAKLQLQLDVDPME